MSVSHAKTSRNGRVKPAPGVAFYTLEGTLTGQNLMHAVLYILGNLGELHRRVITLASLALRFPGMYMADDPTILSGALLESLKNVSADRLGEIGLEYCERVLSRRLFPAAINLLEANRKAGIEPVLLTTLPSVIAAPLCRRLEIADFAASRLIIARNRATGRVAGPLMIADHKAEWCAEYAGAHDLDARGCWAYADSFSDLPFLASVGHPVAVNPDRNLYAAAMGRQWPILRFEKSIEHESDEVSRADILEFSGGPADGSS